MEERRILLGVTGGIAAYKAPLIIRLLQRNHAQVRAVVTEHALEFVTETTLASLTGFPVARGLFDRKEHNYEHIELAKWCDALVVAPATANAIAKFACGVADDLLSTLFVAMKRPAIIAPAMNEAMFADDTSAANIRTLMDRGCAICNPGSGYLACGDQGTGRMAEPEEIVEATLALLRRSDALRGKKVLVTAGGCREYIDPVRFITNRSSGKMGYAIASAFATHGADVTLISAPASLSVPYGAKMIRVETSGQMYDEVMKIAGDQDIIVKAAAVADYMPEQAAGQKIKKTGDSLTIKLTRTKDILAELGAGKKPGAILVGFSAETENLAENAARKLIAKNLDMIALNDVSGRDSGFDVDVNRVAFIRKAAPGDSENVVEIGGDRFALEQTALESKNRIAHLLVEKIISLVERNK